MSDITEIFNEGMHRTNTRKNNFSAPKNYAKSVSYARRHTDYFLDGGMHSSDSDVSFSNFKLRSKPRAAEAAKGPRNQRRI